MFQCCGFHLLWQSLKLKEKPHWVWGREEHFKALGSLPWEGESIENGISISCMHLSTLKKNIGCHLIFQSKNISVIIIGSALHKSRKIFTFSVFKKTYIFKINLISNWHNLFLGPNTAMSDDLENIVWWFLKSKSIKDKLWNKFWSNGEELKTC